MKFCSECAAPVLVRIPDGDNRPRHVCANCNTIHYSNPKVVAGCVVTWEDKILLCKRAIQPRYGLWTVPAGFLENGETVQAGAQRETMEEACAHVEIDDLYAVYNIAHVDQIYMIFRGHLNAPVFATGLESLEVGLYKEDEIPWDKLAFKVVTETLMRFYSDQKRGSFRPFVGDIVR
ncbi:MAG: NUDIX hydrolase [Arenicellales bacterium WSBS_2016_MAG_OTU3]